MIKIKYSRFIILGSGPAGYTAAIYLNRSNLNPILLTGNQIGGQLINTNEIENWPGIKFSISGLELMNNFFIQIKKMNNEILFEEIFSLNLLLKPIFLLGKKNFFYSDILIISTGANSKFLNFKNKNLYLGKNISTCAICDGNFYKNKKILIVGGSSVSIENTIYLSNLSKNIILIHRKNFFSSDFSILKRFFNNIFFKNIFIRLNTFILEIFGDKFILLYIKLRNLINKEINIINIDGLFLFIGYNPNSKIFFGQLKFINKYIYIKYKKFFNFSKTNIPSIFSSGDINDQFYKQAITSSGFGCISAFDSTYYYNKINL